MVANSNYDIVSVFYLNRTLLTDLRKSFQSHVSSWFVLNAPGVEKNQQRDFYCQATRTNE